MSTIQEFIRSEENEESSTSIRDVKRFMSYFKFFDAWDESILNFNQKFSISVTISYLLRIGNAKTKKSLIAKI